MAASLVAVVAAEGGQGRPLPIPPVAFALLAVAFFGALLLVTFAFRSVSNRQRSH